mmetsp:Transcript_1712/g.3220  ORF Transcript_1712/g.3220 Transcript_1712/m.3220 type:complete len:82 (-) Transcript_1712:66-311(-)
MEILIFVDQLISVFISDAVSYLEQFLMELDLCPTRGFFMNSFSHKKKDLSLESRSDDAPRLLPTIPYCATYFASLSVPVAA